MHYKGGFVHYDVPIGVLCLESYFPKPPGHVRNPLSFRFPTVCHVLKGVDVNRMLYSNAPDLVEPFLEGARILEREGVKGIVGSCGFMALFQQELSSSVRIPVASSSLLQLPFIRLLQGSGTRVGVLTANGSVLTSVHFRAVGVDIKDYPIRGLETSPVFSSLFLQQTQQDMDVKALQREVCDVAAAFSREEALDALVLECTDLSAFAAPIQAVTGIPVYDVNSLAEYVAYNVRRLTYPPADREEKFLPERTF